MTEYVMNAPPSSPANTLEVVGCLDSERQSAQALLSRLAITRHEYDQAVADFLDALRRYSTLPLSDLEKQELLRQSRQREEAAFNRYKQLLDAMPI